MRGSLLCVLLGSLLLSGCVAGIRLGVGPTADTRFGIGANVTLSGHFGVVDTHGGLGFVAVVEGSAGGQLNPAAPTLRYMVGWDVIETTPEHQLRLRFGIRARADWRFQDTATPRLGVDLVLGASPDVMRRLGLGFEARLGAGWEESARSGAVGTLGVSLVYDLMVMEGFD